MGVICCYNIFIYKSDGKIKLIETNTSGKIRIWDFHSSNLLNKIDTDIDDLSVCLWNEQYILFGGKKCVIKVYDLNKKKTVNILFNIKKINHPLYGKSLIFFDKNSIKFSQIIETESKPLLNNLII